MEVLTKILQQGTEFETLAETVLADRFERLVELVTMIGDKGELPIAMALASVVANPHMVQSLLLLLLLQGSSKPNPAHEFRPSGPRRLISLTLNSARKTY